MEHFSAWKAFLGIVSAIFLSIISLFYGGQGETPPSVSVPISVPATITTTTPPEAQVPTTPTSLKEDASVQSPPEQHVSTPGPLIVPSTSSATASGNVLTGEAIVLSTNIEREKVGLPTLSSNKDLALIAEDKAVDMNAKQYFAHVAPDGTDIAALAKKYGYQFLNIGENLALGDFDSDAEVVTGWMNSPGHRANILNTAYTEIGVAAIRGTWKGREVWYAVQEFGRPLPACPQPERLLKEKITIYQNELDALATTLEHLKADIEASREDQEAVSLKIGDYNTIVELYNSLIPITRADIEKYDAAARAFNICVGSE